MDCGEPTIMKLRRTPRTKSRLLEENLDSITNHISPEQALNTLESSVKENLKEKQQEQKEPDVFQSLGRTRTKTRLIEESLKNITNLNTPGKARNDMELSVKEKREVEKKNENQFERKENTSEKNMTKNLNTEHVNKVNKLEVQKNDEKIVEKKQETKKDKMAVEEKPSEEKRTVMFASGLQHAGNRKVEKKQGEIKKGEKKADDKKEERLLRSAKTTEEKRPTKIVDRRKVQIKIQEKKIVNKVDQKNVDENLEKKKDEKKVKNKTENKAVDIKLQRAVVQKNEKIWTLNEDLYIIIILCIFLLTIFGMMWLCRPEIELPNETSKQTLAWNVDSLKQDFKSHVYGQDYATSKIIKKLRRLNHNFSNFANKNPEIIFLLGGPGVGKHHTLNMISAHTQNTTKIYYYQSKNTVQKVIENKCKIVSSLQCNRKFSTFSHIDWMKPSKGALPLYGNITNIEHFLQNLENCALGKNLQCSSNLFSMNVYFVTGSIMSSGQLIKFRNAAEYEDYIDNVAYKLNKYMHNCAPNISVTMIKFDPMYPEFVKHFLKNKNYLPEKSIDYIIDTTTVNNFLPFGCKNMSDVSTYVQ